LGYLPGSSFDTAYAINADGTTIVGSSGYRAVRWSSDVPQLLGSVPSMPYSNASAISGDGRIIAGSWFNPGVSSGTFVWTEATGMVDLETLLASRGVDVTGWDFFEIKGISADGSSLIAFGSVDGELAGILVTDFAVPEATPLSAAVSLLGFGVASTWLRARRQRLA
jgi:probable HAF family extracellular repeat protein